VALGDELIKIIKEFDAEFEPKYNKFYIGLAKDGRPQNFASFRPMKNGLRLDLKIKKSEKIEEKLDELGIDLIDYSKWGTYRIRITKSAIENNSDFLKDLLQDSYTEWTSL